MGQQSREKEPFALTEDMISTFGAPRLLMIRGPFETDQENRLAIKAIVNSVSYIHPNDIDDEASFKETLHLDDLAILEIGVEIEHAFGLPNGTCEAVTSIPEAV